MTLRLTRAKLERAKMPPQMMQEQLASERKQRAADENTAMAKSKLKELKRKPMACSAAAVVRFIDCLKSAQRTGDSVASLVDAPDL